MHKVTKIQPIARHRLHVEFCDGIAGEIDLEDRLFGSVFEPLKNADVFAQVTIDEFGVICWPTGADLAPDALYDAISRRGNRD